MFIAWSKVANEEMHKEPYLRQPAFGSNIDRFLDEIALDLGATKN